MRTITLRLAPCLVPAADGTLAFTYRTTCLDAVSTLFGEPTTAVFGPPGQLANLHTLSVHVLESSSYNDAHWWCHVLRKRLGPVPTAITVSVDYCE